VGQRTLFPKTRSRTNERGSTEAGAASKKESYSFHMKKMKLRETHKRLRAGLVVWEDVDAETQGLLIRFYGYNVLGVQG